MKLSYTIGLCLFLLPLSLFAEKPVKTFTETEINHVRATTPNLFSKSNKLELHLDKMLDKEYCFPLEGAKIISNYGLAGGRKGHSGIDIKTRANDTIRCAFNGVVRMSKPYHGYGEVIVVRHPMGLETIYSHNAKNFVHSGDKVCAGQAIALTGRTGRATTEHLHFETRVNGEHFNPNIIFNMKEHTLRKKCIVCIKSAKGIVVKPVDNK